MNIRIYLILVTTVTFVVCQTDPAFSNTFIHFYSCVMQVRAHEPLLALDGGGGPGTDALDAVCRGAAALLRPGGFLALETAGGEQAHLPKPQAGALGRCGSAFRSTPVTPP